ncbi:MAG: hypothetical protein KME42_07875 [Tildeniella nuda ZEHNDER 1965/U140]|nr:hypothetical protein [Tildeniella nuda ZEHNDER 1965/U140]
MLLTTIAPPTPPPTKTQHFLNPCDRGLSTAVSRRTVWSAVSNQRSAVSGQLFSL